MKVQGFRALAVAVLLPALWTALPLSALAQPSVPAFSGIDLGNPTVTPIEPAWQSQSSPIEHYCGILRRFFRNGEWYVSVGAGREWWGHTNISVTQPALGNNFTVYDVRGVDDGSWGSLFGGQYNIRIGRFIDEARTVAVEVSLDHTKYTSVLGQYAHLSGTVAGQPTDAVYRLDEGTFNYLLHNGVNHVMVSLVKRVPLIGETNETFSVAAIGKVGLGAVIPHANNTIFGQTNDVGQKTIGNLIGFDRGWWQVNGFTAGFEFGIRVVFCKPLYLEITDKVAFAQLNNVPVFQGTARHSLWMNEVMLNVGITFGPH